MWYIPVKKDILSELIQSTPVPVYFVDDTSGYRGFYEHYGEFEFDADHHIEILNRMEDCAKIATLVHEISHADCDRKNCECLKNPDRKYREIHAYECTLKWLLKRRLKDILRAEMGHVTGLLERDDHYTEAAKYIIQSKLWQKCLKYVGKL